MKTSTKIILSIVLALIIVGIIAYEVSPRAQVGGTASPAGSTNSTGRIAQAIINPSNTITSTTSYASLLNTDTTDRIIKEVYFYLPAVAVTNTLTMATSTASAGTPGTTILTITNSTSTTPLYLASTTPGLTTGAGYAVGYRVWAAGSYLQFNSTATDTAQVGGIVGVVYMPN